MRGFTTLGRFVGWLLAYALIAPFAWCLGRRRRAGVCLGAGLALLALACWHRRVPQGAGLRVSSFNIESYGRKPKDERRLVELLGSLDSDIIAVQEIQEPDRFAELVRGVPARRYTFAASSCGGKRQMHVGFVFDAERVRLLRQQEYPELDADAEADTACSRQDRPGLLGEFVAGEARLDLLVVHLAAGPDTYPKRQQQWAQALAIVAHRRELTGVPVGIIGDVNSTGYLDDAQGERTFLRRRLHEAGMNLLTARLACSEYFVRDGKLEPSLLDHLAVSDGFPLAQVAEVHGYCEEAACQPLGSAPLEFDAVSDHCPITVGAR